VLLFNGKVEVEIVQEVEDFNRELNKVYMFKVVFDLSRTVNSRQLHLLLHLLRKDFLLAVCLWRL
jgi:hypothetical protein